MEKDAAALVWDPSMGYRNCLGFMVIFTDVEPAICLRKMRSTSFNSTLPLISLNVRLVWLVDVWQVDTLKNRTPMKMRWTLESLGKKYQGMAPHQGNKQKKHGFNLIIEVQPSILGLWLWDTAGLKVVFNLKHPWEGRALNNLAVLPSKLKGGSTNTLQTAWHLQVFNSQFQFWSNPANHYEYA